MLVADPTFTEPMTNQPTLTIDDNAALIVIDVQQGFDDPAWGRTTNPSCLDNCLALVEAWTVTGRPIVVVRHDSTIEGSPLHPSHPGNAVVQELDAVDVDLSIAKSVNSAFYGSPDLRAWLEGNGIGQIVLVGIQTNMCVETTARMGGNLGFRVVVALDATRTFDLAAPVGPDGAEVALGADELMAATAVSLHGGRFATVTSTKAVLDAATAGRR